ncbi:MAG TPA: hypothetical protein VFS20_07395 [Longimicrobium sp.]|nr:hypothetical protein [Longimicrobium sp.]
MHRHLRILPFLAALAAAPLPAQRTEVVRRDPADSVANRYRVHAPAGQPRALLVLLPGYGGDVNSFEPTSGYSPSTLPARLAAQGVLTIVAVPHPETLYETDRMLLRLDSMVAEVVQRYRVPPQRVAIGGFSAGGTGAVRYAQHCAAGRCRAVPKVAAVVAVDAPLDFERMARGAEVHVRRQAPRTNLAEERMVLETLRRALGGSPDEAREAYRRVSPVLASEPDGGNARLLSATAIRLYTEPDVQWWIEQRNLDYHGMNAVDHAALINLLRIAGNQRAELIATTGRGFRPDGRRHPHSWSIVDEEELARWLAAMLIA